MENDQPIRAEMYFGTVEIKTWMEATMKPDGDWLLSGNSCAIHRRRDGTIKDVTFKTSGVEMTVPMGYEHKTGFIGRVFKRLWHNVELSRPAAGTNKERRDREAGSA